MAPTALDTPLSLSPEPREEHTLSIRPKLDKEPFERTSHADIVLTEWNKLHAICDGDRHGYKPVFVDHGNRIGLAHVVAVAK